MHFKEPQEQEIRMDGRVKRVFDFAAASVLLIASAPVILACMLLVKLTSSGPGIYRQTRLGRGRRPFTIYKIRTMSKDSEALTGARWATANDSRVTPIGRILRRTHLDELPQLWNILRGDMSLVGPRPERPEFIDKLEPIIHQYAERMLVRPGVTGLAQVNLPPDTDIESVRRKLIYDRFYVQSGGMWLDLRLVAVTALSLLGIPFRASCAALQVPGAELEFSGDVRSSGAGFLVAAAD
jgi:lipopolysaccharide/colanic/teichoic acid biosynthesis glycosyltransferase